MLYSFMELVDPPEDLIKQRLVLWDCRLSQTQQYSGTLQLLFSVFVILSPLMLQHQGKDFARITLMNHMTFLPACLGLRPNPTNFILPGLAEGPTGDTVSFTCRDNFEFINFLHFSLRLPRSQYNSLTFASLVSLRLIEAIMKFLPFLTNRDFFYYYLLFIICFLLSAFLGHAGFILVARQLSPQTNCPNTQLSGRESMCSSSMGERVSSWVSVNA